MNIIMCVCSEKCSLNLGLLWMPYGMLCMVKSGTISVVVLLYMSFIIGVSTWKGRVTGSEVGTSDKSGVQKWGASLKRNHCRVDEISNIPLMSKLVSGALNQVCESHCIHKSIVSWLLLWYKDYVFDDRVILCYPCILLHR